MFNPYVGFAAPTFSYPARRGGYKSRSSYSRYPYRSGFSTAYRKFRRTVRTKNCAKLLRKKSHYTTTTKELFDGCPRLMYVKPIKDYFVAYKFGGRKMFGMWKESNTRGLAKWAIKKGYLPDDIGAYDSKGMRDDLVLLVRTYMAELDGTIDKTAAELKVAKKRRTSKEEEMDDV